MRIAEPALKPIHLTWILVVVFSLVIRVPGLYDTSYQWRPLHTEITAYWFVQEGIHLTNYQTPLFGPPWQIPIEFPLFQALAALVFKTGLGSFDFACRLTALLCFYFSAFFLYCLCRKIFSDNTTTFLTLSLYLWLPFNIYYSTEPLIDYLALAFALAYLYFILKWLDTPATFWKALLATICGSLGVLVKPTTMPVVAIPIIVFVGRDIWAVYTKKLQPSFHGRNILRTLSTQRFYWLALIMMAVLPVLLGVLWTRHTDLIKSNSLFTEWHTSKAMAGWYFGTWALRLNQNVWINHISETQRLLLPYGLSIIAVLGVFVAAGIFRIPAERSEIRFFILSILASLVVVLAIFLSLYQQQYYFISLSASMAIVGGYSLSRFWQLSQKKGHVFVFLFVTWGILFLALNARDYKTQREIALLENRKLEKTIARAQRVQKHVPPNNWVVVVAYDWDPLYVFPLERKAMFVTPRELGKPICQVLADEHFSLVVVGDRGYERNEELLNYAFQCFESTEEVLPGVFAVTH